MFILLDICLASKIRGFTSGFIKFGKTLSVIVKYFFLLIPYTKSPNNMLHGLILSRMPLIFHSYFSASFLYLFQFG